MPPKRQASKTTIKQEDDPDADATKEEEADAKQEPAQETTEEPTKTAPFPTPALSNTPLRMSYRIARGEQGVLTFEPYKSLLLPHWRFRTPAIARASSAALWRAFTAFVAAGDFVGADMARKFVQMGMTRAKRYANHAGGRKYARREDGTRGEELARSAAHEGRADKLEASDVFKGVWGRCRADVGYQRLKGEFVAEQRAWDRLHPRGEVSKLTGQVGGGGGVKHEVDGTDEGDVAG